MNLLTRFAVYIACLCYVLPVHASGIDHLTALPSPTSEMTPDTLCGPYSSAPSLPIDDNNDPKDTITISLGNNQIITDLDLVIQIHHTFLQDLDIRLTSPAGTTISIMEDQCDDNDTLFVQFDDDAPALICNLATIGQFAPPNGMLSDFNNELVDGDWVLEIFDDASGDNGTLVSWCLLPTTEEVECFAPSGLQSNAVTSTTATLSWNPTNLPPEMMWDIEVVPLGTDPTGTPTYPIVGTNPYVATGLDPATTYAFYIRANCDVVSSPWAGPKLFTTNLTNPSACSMGLAIQDNSCNVLNEFNIEVASAPGISLGGDIELEEVRLIVQHTWISDLEIRLNSPSGVSVPISLQNGSSGDNYGIPDSLCDGYTIFTAEGCNALPVAEGVAPFSGVFIPDGNLSDFSDGSSPIGEWTLSICDVAGDDIGTLEYVELVFEELGCQAPSNLIADNISAEFAQLTWMPGNDCNQTIIEYGPPGFIPGTDDQPGSIQSEVIVIACPGNFPFNLAGLTESTPYEIYIRQQCTTGAYSENSCPIQLTTNCKTQAISLVENFDAQPTCPTSCGSSCAITGTWKNVSDDALEWLIDANGTTSTKTGPSDDISGGGNYIYIESFGSTCPDFAEGILRSNCMAIDASEGVCHMSFSYHMYGEKINQLSLEISNDDGQNWSTLWSLYGDQGNEWFNQFIDLGSYDGDTVQFQFVGVNSDGSRADIALDEITFYGSVDLGEPSFVYYPDQDGDGFGAPVDSTVSCSSTPPAGFVANNLDCNDEDFLINPGSPEISCNGIDENCNGLADDAILADPTAIGNTICSGETGTFEVISSPEGTLYWYSSPDDTIPIATGPMVEQVLNQTTTLFVQDSIFQNMTGCKSDRIPVTVQVFSTPDIIVDGPLSLCLGDTTDLEAISIVDANDAGGLVTYHHSLPPDINNELLSTVLLLNNDTTFFVQSLTPNGCRDIDSINIGVYPNPTATITTPGEVTLCSGKATQLEGHVQANTDSVTFFWNTGFTDSTLIVFGSQNPGTTDLYTFTVVDSTGCSDTDSIEVFTSESISGASIDQIVNVSVCDGDDGSITISPINGTSPYTFQWSGPVSGDTANVDSTLQLSNLKQGVYQVTITDNSLADCPLIVPVIVVNGPSVVVNNVNIIPVSCAGAQDGGIQLSVSGNNPQFLWSTMETTSSISDLNGGTYSVTITGSTCEVVLDNLEVTEPDVLGIGNVLVTPTSCFGENDGAIKLIVQGGTAPYFYQWSHGPTSSMVSNLESGLYSVTISDLRGCSAVNSLFVPSPSPIGFGVDSIKHISCNGAVDGSIFITPFGGTAPYSFQWNTSSVQEDLNNVPDGDYQVVVSDKNGCAFLSSIIPLDEPELLTVTLDTIEAPSCDGVKDGLIRMQVSGGTPPYTYSWNQGTGGLTNANLGVGSYLVTVTDANDCTAISDTFQITAPNVLDIQLLTFENASCEGINDGKIELGVVGGTPPFDYQWSNGADASLVENLGADTLFCGITDANGCFSLSDTFVVEQPQLINVNVDLVKDVRCSGAADGSIFITVNGQGTLPYSFEWSDGAISEDRPNIPPGSYSCHIEDAEGCTIELSAIDIASPEPLEILVNSIENVFCAGGSDGSIDISATGGVLPYTYSWDNGSQSEDLVNITAGVYKLTLLDQNDCAVTSLPFQVTEPPSIEVEEINITEIDCNGNDGGGVDLMVEGGLLPFEFLWSNGDTTEDLNNVSAGKYVVTITDQNDCAVIVPQIEVVEPTDSLMVFIDTVADVSCNNAADGMVSAQIEGGTPPYQFLWSNAVDSSTTLTGLEGGTYQITITDQNGCVAISSQAVVEEPFLFFALTDSIRQPVCAGDSTGAIFVSVSGGLPPYTYNWVDTSGNVYANTQDATNLPEGVFINEVTDAKGCTVTSMPMILEYADSMNIQLVNLKPTCTGDSTGLVEVSASGGQFPYQYNWNSGAHSEDLTNLGPGSYQLTLSDNRGCTIVSDTFVVDSFSLAPLSVSLSEQTNISCKNEATGTLTIEVEGGTPNYDFFWNSGQDTAFIADLSAGSYFCVIFDQNGCNVETPVYEITEPATAVEITLDSIVDNTCPNALEGGIFVSVEGGAPPYEFDWSTGIATEDLTNAATGPYSMSVIDQNNCLIQSPTYYIEGPPMFLIQVLSTPVTQGLNDGTASVEVIGGTPPYDYQWDAAAGNQMTSLAVNLAPGTYEVTITDDLNCDTTLSVVVDLFTSVKAPTSKVLPVVIYPNPSEGKLFAAFQGIRPKVAFHWKIYNGLGKPLMAGIEENNAVRILPMDLSSYPPGMYYMEIRIGNQRGIYRFTIQR